VKVTNGAAAVDRLEDAGLGIADLLPSEQLQERPVRPAMNADAGMVKHPRPHDAVPRCPKRIADSFVMAPTPTIAPVMVCVVETGMRGRSPRRA